MDLSFEDLIPQKKKVGIDSLSFDDLVPTKNWSDIPGQALKNAPASAAQFVGSLYQAIRHPVDTASGMMDVAAGGLRNLVPESIRSMVDAADWNPEAAQRATRAADTVGEFYKNRYGSMEGLKNTLATDPVGALADASTVLGGGGAVARAGSNLLNLPRVAGVADRVATVGNAINPVSLGLDAAKLGAKGVGGTTNVLQSMVTGAGPKSYAEAWRSGFEGGNAGKTFRDNLPVFGDGAPMTDVVDTALSAAKKMREEKQAAYKQGIASTAADTKPLNFTPIDDALSSALAELKSPSGKWKATGPELDKIKELQATVAEWRNSPAPNTAMELDALKQRIEGLYPHNPDFSRAQRAITQVKQAVKSTIVDQSPEYAKTMKDYSGASKAEGEIRKALSMGPDAAADTTLRKLQSVTRNDVSSNYGNRAALVEQLAKHGGGNIMPALAGQSLNSWAPRGLARLGTQIGGMGMAGAAGAQAINPLTLAALTLTSPKLQGLLTHNAGRAAGGVHDLLTKGYLTPEELKLIGLLGSRQQQAQ